MTGPESRWRELLDLALPALDYVFGTQVDHTARPAWTLGGGTAIAIRLDHRISHDVDLFVPGVPLKLFTPARNPAALRISSTFQWPGHYLKFQRPEGEIDFLSPALQTELGYIWMDHGGRRIAVETPEEVIVKKVRFRSARFTARDVFDLAAVADACPGLVGVLAREVSDAIPRAQEAVEVQARRGIDALAASVIVGRPGGDSFSGVFDVARRTLALAAALSASEPG